MKKFISASCACSIIPFAVLLGAGGEPVHAAGGALTLLPMVMNIPGATLVGRDLRQAVPMPATVSQFPAGPLPNGVPVARMIEGAMQPLTPPAADPPATVPVTEAIPAPVVRDPQPVAASSASAAPHSASPAAADLDAGSGTPGAPMPGADLLPPPGAVESLRDAIVAALKNNPDIQIALAQQDDARYAIGEATAGYLPHVDMTVGYGREVARSGHTAAATHLYRTEGTVTVSQNVWDFGTTINDIARARASYRSAQWATREQIEGISYDITNAYLGLLQQQKLIVLTQQEIAANQKILRMVAVQKDLGLTTQADVDRAKARLENVQSTLLDRKSAMQQARDSYKRLTNHSPALAVDLKPSEGALPPSVDAAVDMIDSNSPRMAQAVEDRKSLAKQYASQTGTFLPRVGLLLQGNHKYDVQGNNGLADDARAMVTVSYSFFNGGADIATRNRIGARLREADYELDRRRREVEQDLRADFDALSAARQKIATINAEIDAAQRVADLYKQQFREGKRTVFDLLDSQQVLFSALDNEVVNEIAMHAAEYRVLQKLGGLFDLVSAGEPLPPLVVPAPVAPQHKAQSQTQAQPQTQPAARKAS